MDPVTCSVIYHLQDRVLLPKSLLGNRRKWLSEKLTSQVPKTRDTGDTVESK